jgi:hypothetical protein
MPALILEPLEEAPTAPAGDGRLDAGHRADPACPPGKRRRKETEAQAAGRGAPDREILRTGCFRRGLKPLESKLH